MKFFGMALVAGLVVLETLAASSLAAGGNSAPTPVECKTEGGRAKTTVTAANTTLQVTCPIEKYTIEPAAVVGRATQEVFDDAQCQERKPLTFYCTDATGKSLTHNGHSGLELTFPSLPPAPKSFFLQCKAPTDGANKNCVVEVSVNAVAGGQQGPSGNDNSPDKGEEPGTGNQHDNTSGNQQVPGGADAPGGTADVQTCGNPNTSITIRLPEQGSLAKFACQSGFNLYPSLSNKVFSKDCKKQETLKDMTRTQTSAPTSTPGPNGTGPHGAEATSRTQPAAAGHSPPGAQEQPSAASTVVYTLKADKKPPKKTLCYLCAKQGATEQQPGKAGDYCTIYVESGACRQSRRGLAFALVLPCVLVVLYFA